MFISNVIFKFANTKNLNKILKELMSEHYISQFIKKIIEEIEKYPLIKRDPISFMINFSNFIYLVIKFKPKYIHKIIIDIDKKLKENYDINTDEFIEFLENLNEKYEIRNYIIIKDNIDKYIFVSAGKVLFDRNDKLIKFHDNSFTILKQLANNYEARIIITTKEKNRQIKDLIMKEFIKHEIYDISFAKSGGIIYHKDIIKNFIKDFGIQNQNYIIFNKRKKMGKTLKDRLITVYNGITDKNIEKAHNLFSINSNVK